MLDTDALLIYALLALAVVLILALAGAEISVRRGADSGNVSIRSIIRALCGHHKRERNHEDPPP